MEKGRNLREVNLVMQKVNKGPGNAEVIGVGDGDVASRGWGHCGYLQNSDVELK